jgi:hypothetical protein
MIMNRNKKHCQSVVGYGQHLMVYDGERVFQNMKARRTFIRLARVRILVCVSISSEFTVNGSPDRRAQAGARNSTGDAPRNRTRWSASRTDSSASDHSQHTTNLSTRFLKYAVSHAIPLIGDFSVSQTTRRAS